MRVGRGWSWGGEGRLHVNLCRISCRRFPPPRLFFFRFCLGGHRALVAVCWHHQLQAHVVMFVLLQCIDVHVLFSYTTPYLQISKPTPVFGDGRNSSSQSYCMVCHRLLGVPNNVLRSTSTVTGGAAASSASRRLWQRNRRRSGWSWYGRYHFIALWDDPRGAAGV